MTSAAPLSRDELLELLEDLSHTLARSDERARMFVVGGAAMSLGYDQTRTTRDVDALFEPKPCVYSAVADVAARHGLDPDWLNDAAKVSCLARTPTHERFMNPIISLCRSLHPSTYLP